jgi:hypothetical protein
MASSICARFLAQVSEYLLRRYNFRAKERPMRNLKQVAIELDEKLWFSHQSWKGEDEDATAAIQERDRDLADRRRTIVSWLNSYSALMGLSNSVRDAIAGQIIRFAGEKAELHCLAERCGLPF